MSFDAMKWALEQETPSAATKLILVVLSSYAGIETQEAYPSCAELCAVSQLNRKTVLAGLVELAKKDLIRDTGRKVGATQQVRVFKVMCGSSPKNGTVQTVPKTGRIPKTDGNGPVFTRNGPENGIRNKSGTNQEQGRRPLTIYDLDDMKRAKQEAISKLKLKHYLSGPMGGWSPPDKEAVFKRLRSELEAIDEKRSGLNP